MWAIKIIKSGAIGKRRYIVDHYWAGRHHHSVKKLEAATHYKDRDKAEGILGIISRRNVKNPPDFKIVEIAIAEVEE